MNFGDGKMIFGVQRNEIIKLILLIIIFIGLLYFWYNKTPENLLSLISKQEVYYLYKFGKNFGIKKNLKKGDKGFEVQLLQVVLKEEVDPHLKVTGYFYDNTEKALKRFQQKYNLKIIGYLDDKTLEKINEVYITRLCPRPIKEFSDFLLFNVSKNNRLPIDYIPHDLEKLPNDVDSEGIVCLRKEAKEKLIEMLNDAKKEGLEIIVVSGFRRSEVQEFLYNVYFKKFNKRAFDIIAPPGHSEHQLGTAVDLDSKRNRTGLETHFEKTPEGKWLIENAWRYGFVLSYPKGKKQITGYEYEPWHYRYVGQEIASIVKNKNITLIEYLNNLYISQNLFKY